MYTRMCDLIFIILLAFKTHWNQVSYDIIMSPISRGIVAIY